MGTTDGGRDEAAYRAPDLALVGAEHVRRYRETGGDVGYVWNGVTALLLTTIGRVSGEPRTSALIFGDDGGDGDGEGRYVVIASQGGAPTHPQWYRNLVARPLVEVQIKGECFAAVARTAEGAERERLWTLMAGLWPNYEAYRERTDRVIPVVVLERVASEGGDGS
ncbi:nitroreductase family deazaflavin-dependent oxidoreductase [Uniformispora flossi]|uniref:nitroreductase family deazaflavin-dependent oxidoreductase n=1 Tax=Uniformispora flossi TaxID=3390723 RepID=UPI003C3026EA